MSPVVFKEPNFNMASSTAPTLVSGREKSPTISRRMSKVPVHLTKLQEDRKLSMSPALLRRSENFFTGRAKLICLGAVALIVAIAAGILAIRFTRDSRSSSSSNTIWSPRVNSTFQIDLSTPISDLSVNASVYDIDLFSNSAATVAKLHALNRKVICYFSAGTFSSSSSDAALFEDKDIGNLLTQADSNLGGMSKPSSDERWLDTRSESVRSAMLARMDLAVKQRCDGIDPDHTNSYLSSTSFPLSRSTALSYLQFLSDAAEKRGLAMGLRNTGEVVEETVAHMGWSINQGCETAWNCALYWPFINKGKPVWHVVVIDSDEVTEEGKKEFWCAGSNTAGFETILKKREGGSWMEAC